MVSAVRNQLGDDLNDPLVSLAMLRVLARTRSHSLLDAFVPLVAWIVSEGEYPANGSSGVTLLRSSFEEAYGLRIPHYPMVSILEKARNQQYITAMNGTLRASKSKLDLTDISTVRAEQTAGWEQAMEAFLLYAGRHGHSLTRVQAEHGFLAFVKARDVDILFADKGGSLLPEFAAETDALFLANKFIAFASKEMPSVFDFVVRMATGHVLATTVMCRAVGDYSGGLKGLRVYLDVGIVLRLAGITTDGRQEITADLLRSLSGLGVQLRLFRTHV